MKSLRNYITQGPRDEKTADDAHSLPNQECYRHTSSSKKTTDLNGSQKTKMETSA